MEYIENSVSPEPPSHNHYYHLGAHPPSVSPDPHLALLTGRTVSTFSPLPLDVVRQAFCIGRVTLLILSFLWRIKCTQRSTGSALMFSDNLGSTCPHHVPSREQVPCAPSQLTCPTPTRAGSFPMVLEHPPKGPEPFSQLSILTNKMCFLAAFVPLKENAAHLGGRVHLQMVSTYLCSAKTPSPFTRPNWEPG